MASGMEMMLKSFGFDPEKMRQDIAKYAQIIVEMDNRQSRLEHMISEQTGAINRLTFQNVVLVKQLEMLNAQLSSEQPNERQHDDTGERIAG